MIVVRMLENRQVARVRKYQDIGDAFDQFRDWKNEVSQHASDEIFYRIEMKSGGKIIDSFEKGSLPPENETVSIKNDGLSAEEYMRLLFGDYD